MSADLTRVALLSEDFTAATSCLVVRAEPGEMLGSLKKLTCEQGFRPVFNALSQRGHKVVPEADGTYASSIVHLTRQRAENKANISRALSMTVKGGPVAVTGAKTDGIESILRDLRRFNLVEEVVSKAHGKAVLLRVPEDIPEEIRGWTSALVIQPNQDGFATSAAMFSSDSPDEGSTLLCPFIGDLSDRVADLGAGWGYLASEAAKSAKLSELHLFEAEYRAIEAARQNVKDPRAEFHWLDISEIEDRGFDAVVCNPPFHVSRTADPDIGRNFIKVAARILKPNGSFLLVANRQLPYEAVLSQCFRIVRSLKETNKYKVIQATGVAK